MSSCSTPWRAEYASWQTEARTPGTLLAVTLAPTPLPQMTMPRHAWAEATLSATALAKSGKSSRGSRECAPHVVNLMAEGLQEWQELLFQLKAAVVGAEGEFFSC